MGDPMRPLMWVSKSHAKLAAALRAMGHQIATAASPNCWALLKYRRQVNRKTLEGSHNPDRNAQFEHINAAVIATQAAGKPVISVDTKKKELVGAYKNGGSDYGRKAVPTRSTCTTSWTRSLARSSLTASTTSRPTPAVSASASTTTPRSSRSIRSGAGGCRWAASAIRTSNQLMITADGGGSNGSRVRLWKVELQKLADETGLTLQVCHYPPGTSKWNKIEHRLFCHITQNWRGKPLVSREAVVELIASTTTKTGLTVRCELDTRDYPKGIKVSDAEMATLNIKGDTFHPEWNYTISPRTAT